MGFKRSWVRIPPARLLRAIRGVFSRRMRDENSKDGKSPNESSRNDAHCVYRNVARLLEEEPQLEAVAFQPKNHLLSIATLGTDRGHRLATRVTEAVAEREQQCGILDASGICAQCGEAPARKV